MRQININELSDKLKSLINDNDPVDEDIKITDDDNNIVAVVIPEDAYNFFLKIIEEEEDKIDIQTSNKFRVTRE